MVFVLDKHKKPLMHCTEKRARLLLRRGRAVVHRLAPFTIRLKDRVLEDSEVQPLRLKLDPGSKVTGVAVLRGNEVVFLGEIRHRTDIEDRLAKRRMIRRNRRNRKTRYRKPRFLNRHPEKCAGCGKNAKHGSRYCRKCGQRPKDNGNRNTWLPPIAWGASGPSDPCSAEDSGADWRDFGRVGAVRHAEVGEPRDFGCRVPAWDFVWL